MKRLLYIGHDYHNKTQSTGFLKELLNSRYDVDVCDIDPHSPVTYENLTKIKHKHYDIVVCFQVMPSIVQLREKITFIHGVFFPMYDYFQGCVTIENPIWLEYFGFKIINFSKTLHEQLVRMGFSSYYIQYFPKPFDNPDFGDDRAIFFWQRLTNLNSHLFPKILGNIPFDTLHIHQSIDPGQTFVEPPMSYIAEKQITYSSWYENRTDMQKDIEKAAIYIAPRIFEGIGLSFLEAMAMGRCVIAMNNPTMNEYITDGETGLLYDWKNPTPIAATDIRAIQQKTLVYMQKGYRQWEENKGQILDWLESPATPDLKKLSLTNLKMKWSKKVNNENSAEILKKRTKKIIKFFIRGKLREFIRKNYNYLLLKNIVCNSETIYLFGIFPILNKIQIPIQHVVVFKTFGIPFLEIEEKNFGYNK